MDLYKINADRWNLSKKGVDFGGFDLGKKWRESGYYVISMKDDFKTIYGDGVEKIDFSFK